MIRALLIVLVLAASGCGPRPSEVLLIDPISGCQYIGKRASEWGSAKLERRLDAEGQHVCRRQAQP